MIAGRKVVVFETRKDHIGARIVVSKCPFIRRPYSRKKSRPIVSLRNSSSPKLGDGNFAINLLITKSAPERIRAEVLSATLPVRPVFQIHSEIMQ